MSGRRRQLAALLVGILLTALLLHGFAVASGQSMSARNLAQVDDTMTIERLGRTQTDAAAADPRATSTLTETLGATLAANLMLSPITFDLNLPLIVR